MSRFGGCVRSPPTSRCSNGSENLREQWGIGPKRRPILCPIATPTSQKAMDRMRMVKSHCSNAPRTNTNATITSVFRAINGATASRIARTVPTSSTATMKTRVSHHKYFYIYYILLHWCPNFPSYISSPHILLYIAEELYDT